VSNESGAPLDAGEGERLHAARRRRFWLIIGGLALAGMVAGFLAGFVSGYADARGVSPTPLHQTVGGVGVVVMAVVAAYGSWRFFVSVDELELLDNLWGSLIGFYTYAILFPSWWALAKLRIVGDPDHWVIFGASMITATLAYLLRKWRAR
jgi:hypothetical protein